jgi:hypothetical protein
MATNLPAESFAEIAVALRLELRHDVSRFTDQAALAINIGLEPETCARMAAEAQHQANMMAAAWMFFRVACERESQIRALFMEPQPACNDNVGGIIRRTVNRFIERIWGRANG